jgi:mono/diheme cytochrome c family protein
MPNRIRMSLLTWALAFLAGCGAPASKPESPERAAADMMRGGELYRAQCGACHTAQVHWREKSLVHSWNDLRYQISRWQRLSGQNWSREEIEDVAAYLNRIFYQVPCPVPGCGGPRAGNSGSPDEQHRRAADPAFAQRS